MYKYTPIPEGDKIIEEDLKKIKKAVRGEKFESLVLYGAYGKGEGSFIEGKPRNDYDLLLVGEDKETKRAIEEVETLVKPEVWQVKTIEGFPCLQRWYEIKYASILLAGEPLDLPDWQPWDILFADAVASINARILSMLLGKYEMMKEKPDWRKAVEQICKGLISVGDAILIKRGEFSPYYSQRALLLTGDEIGGIYKEAVAIKIYDRPQLNPDQIWRFWARTKEIMLRYIFDNSLPCPYADLLVNLTERVTKEQLEKVLRSLGQENWL